MVVGVGIDLVSVEELGQISDGEANPFLSYVFTERELEYAAMKPNPLEHLAGFFAVKEAVTKAISSLPGSDGIDLRHIETLHRDNGSPYVSAVPPLSTFMERAGVVSILVSITNEHDYASAIAIAQSA